VSAKKIGLLILILGTGAFLETAWSLRGDVRLGPEGCRIIGGRFYGPSFSFEQSAERPLATGASPRVEVRNSFGAVRVTAGAPGVVKVVLRKVVYLASEEKARRFADRIELVLAGDGSPLRVGTNRDELGRSEDVGFETHLELEVPAATVLDVRDEHGPVTVSGVASADVRSSFDDVAIERVAGAVVLETGHGRVRVADIGDTLRLKARHGDVEVDGVQGAGQIDVEHGDLTTRRTGPMDVTLRYGDLVADSVDGDLVVHAAHAGLRASDVTGRADLETSYGDVRLARAGAARARAEHGRVSIEDIAGAAYAQSTHNDVQVERVLGPVEVRVEGGGATLRGLASGGKVQGDGGDLVLEGFSGPVSAQAERGNVRLVPHARIDATITASARRGEIDLEIPAGSRVGIDALSRRGEVHADVPDLVTGDSGAAGHGQRISGSVAGGGPVVQLRSDGDVRIGSGAVTPIMDRPVAKAALARADRPAEAAGAKPEALPEPSARRDHPGPESPHEDDDRR
jgi:DUF4097 and DUF4098 domain-containing protein YvlB